MFKVVKKGEVTSKQKFFIYFMAVVSALVTASVFLMVLKQNPIEVYQSMLDGAFGSKYRFQQTVITAIPLVIASLGIAIAFRMKFWNIGAEGQILMGAFLATFLALNFGDLPKIVLIPLMVIAGIIGGGLWALLPAFLRAKWNTNETITTLMLNYVALKWIVYLQYGPWKDPNAMGFPKIATFGSNAILPKVFGVHIGWIFALVLVVLVYIFMNHSKKGFEIAVLGESENTARYAGININKTIVTAVFLSGGLCGLVGMIQASAVSNTLVTTLTGGIGYTAIITAWLSGLSAPVILVVCFLFAALTQGGAFIQTAFGIPQAAAAILQALILFFVLGSEFFTKYKLVRAEKKKGEVA